MHYKTVEMTELLLRDLDMSWSEFYDSIMIDISGLTRYGQYDWQSYIPAGMIDIWNDIEYGARVVMYWSCQKSVECRHRDIERDTLD